MTRVGECGRVEVRSRPGLAKRGELIQYNAEVIKMKCRICNFLIIILVVMMLLMLHQSWSFAYNNYDNPPCYWEYTPGSRKVIYYRWGNWVDYEWKSAYNISATDWTSATNRVEYRYSTSADNTFNMYY